MVRKHKAFARKHDALIQALLTKHQLRPNSQPKNWHRIFFPLDTTLPNGMAHMALHKFLASGYTAEQWMSFQRQNRDLFSTIEKAHEILEIGDEIRTRLFRLRIFEEAGYARGLEYLEKNENVIMTPFLYELEERLAEHLGIPREQLDEIFKA